MDRYPLWDGIFLDGCDRRADLTFCVALVVIGGIKRIANVSQIVVPFMAIVYVLSAWS